MNNCLHCDKETTNPKFCSSSCSASYNNLLYPRRKPEGECKICATPISTRYTYCSSCKIHSKQYVDWSQVTLSNMTGKRAYQKHSRVRELARKAYNKSNKPKICYNCGYDKHIEVCHIKAISSFSEDIPITEINSLENLLALCPNCHWELDYGNLELETITT